MGQDTYKLVRVINAGRIILGLEKGYGRGADLYEKLEQEELTLAWSTRDRRIVFGSTERGFEIGDYVLVKFEGFKRGIVQDAYKTGMEDDRIYEVYLYDHGLIVQVGDRYVAALQPNWKQQPLPRTVIVQLPGVFPVKRVLNLAKQALGESVEFIAQTSEWPRRTNTLVEQWLQADCIQRLTVTVFKTNDDETVYGDIVRKTSDALESLIDMLLREKLGVENESHRTAQLRLDCTPVKLSKGKDSSRRFLDDTSSDSGNQQPEPSTSKASRMKEATKKGAGKAETKSSEQGDRDSKFLSSSSYSDESSYFDVESNDLDGILEDNNSESDIRMGIPGYLLVRGTYARPPYKRVEDFQLPKKIIKALENIGLSELSSLQKAVAPNFLQGLDLIVIAADGGKHTGKHARLLSYFLTVLRLTYDLYENMENFDGCSPETIIVCNSFASGTNFERFIQSLLKFSHHLPLRVKFMHKDDPKQAWRLPNGVSILILTMKNLSEILQTYKGNKLFDKLRFVIFEEVELYLSQYFADLKNFIAIASGNIRGGTLLPFQLTFSGSKWTDDVESLYKALGPNRAPIVFIHAINQAIRYARIQWNVHHVQQDEKISKLIHLLKTSRGCGNRIVIACSTVPVARAVHEALNDLANIETRLILTNFSQANFDNSKGGHRIISDNFKGGPLIIPDDFMGTCGVTDATCLISFDIPEASKDSSSKKPTAALRFGYFWKKIRYIDDDDNASDPDVNLTFHFLLTGEEHNFYALYKFAETLDNVTFPPKLKALADSMGLEACHKELCEGIKLFGFCNFADPTQCAGRHEFTKQDFRKMTHAPFTGEVEFRITKCENPSLYRVQLLRHYIYKAGKRNCEASYINELKRRSNHLAKNNTDEKIQRKSDFEEGSVWAILDPETNILTRCKITKILSKDVFNNPKTVHVYCIDSGIGLNPSVDDLYQLSKEQRGWAPLVVELVLANLKPPNSEMEYRQIHTKNARKLTEDKIYNAKIWLSIGNTIWVNPMVEYHIDPYTKYTVKGNSIRLDLMGMGAADYNSVHLKNLNNLVRKHGDLYRGSEYEIAPSNPAQDELSESLVKEDFHQIGDDYRWAFVELSSSNKFDPADITTMFGKDPWTFYGVHRKNAKTLTDLETDLSSCIADYISEHYPTYDELFAELYEPQMIVAVKEPDEDKWNRAMIMSKYDLEDQSKQGFAVYFVDHGDRAYDVTAKDMFPIPRKFVARMPFQIIAFKLEHVIPLRGGKEWEETDKEAFLDLILPNCDSKNIELLAYHKVDNSGLPVSCRYYEAVAFLDDKELGELLVEQGKAEYKAGKENLVAEVKDKLLQFYNTVVDGHLRESDDDEDECNGVDGQRCLTFDDGSAVEEDDKFDFNLGDELVQQLMESMGMKAGNKDVVKKINSSDLEEEVLPGPPVGEEPIVEQSTSQSVQLNASSVLTAQEAIKNFNASVKLTPTVKWRQTDTSLILTVLVPDIQEFDLRIGADKRTICFQTLKPANYGFTLKSFGKVVKYDAYPTGQCLKLTFTKRLAGAKWIRVMSDKDAKLMWLKPDTDYVTSEDDEDDEEEDYESDDQEKWLYERDEDEENTEMYLTLEAEAEIGENANLFDSSGSESE
ncbi:unnamed protein product [Orchesella dallaii]|uniref:RNA helicase n=1 Tax=Orchesella dallaii TaxID=48710 RepID=A0ABP1RAE5_9HEXA